MQEIKVEQGTYEWQQLRLGRVTGTRLADAIGSPKVQNTLMCELIAEQLTEQGKDVVVNASMERGQVEEGFARKAYEKATGVTVEKTGFFIADHLDSRIGFSPDGIVREGDSIIGGVEIKNPDSKTFVGYLLAGTVPKDYIEQVMMPFLCIPTVQWWDFIAYDSRIKIADKRMLVVRLTREQLAADLAVAETDLRSFLAKWDETYSKLVF
ncbi:MAG: lambda exonuclease family protein [Planctomycetota bacterium]